MNSASKDLTWSDIVQLIRAETGLGYADASRKLHRAAIPTIIAELEDLLTDDRPTPTNIMIDRRIIELKKHLQS